MTRHPLLAALGLAAGLSANACSDEETSVPGTPPPDAGPPEASAPAEATLRALIAPGEHAAVRVDLAALDRSVLDPTPLLTSTAEQAVALAPGWLRDRLRLRLAMQEAPQQDLLADLVLSAPADELVDEIAFSVANLAETDPTLAAFDAQLITDNAAALYEHAAALPYAEILDSGEPGDDSYESTVRYQFINADGQPATYELPREIYYWWVVHPKLDFEELVPVDPSTGEPAAAPAGVHWRRYTMESSEQTFDYRDHYLLREPHDLRGQALDLSASSHLTAPAIYPLRLFVDDGGHGLLVEVDLGGGTLLASTVDAAARYADDDLKLLVNLASYGNTNLTLQSQHDVALVLDAVPWSLDVYSAALDEQGIVPTIVDSTAFGSLDLASFDKIIVAADQDQAFYQAVAARTADLEAYIQAQGVVQLDLHTSADLSALGFPNDIQIAGGPPSNVVVEGQPRLADYLGDSPIVWDSMPYPGLSGSRPPQVGGMALDLIGWVVTQNMYDNVQEYGEAQGVYNPERTQYPQRILHNHYGNCGELGDLMAAAGRAALLPVRVIESMEDHCWDDVFVDGRWVPWQVDWSDGPTRIDSPGVAYDEEYGGSKTLSGVWTIRGDGYPDESMAPTYTDTATLSWTVRDQEGLPLDGAIVILMTESFYQPQDRALAAVAYTGADGVAELTVGNHRNYWHYVFANLGDGAEYPGDGNPEDFNPLSDMELVAADSETLAGATIEQEITMPGILGGPRASVGSAEGEALATIDARVEASWIVRGAPFTDGRFIKQTQGGTGRFWLLDQGAYDAWVAGGPVQALAAADDVSELQLEGVAVPGDQPLWLVAYNPSLTSRLQVELDLQVVADEAGR